MDANKIIEQAKGLLQPITFEPQSTAYYVTRNGEDMGDEDYCFDCIKDAVKAVRKNYFKQRQEIFDKFEEILKTGCFRGKKLDREYSADEIAQAKKRELKEYPAKATFDYEGHDPDFGGGRHEPNSCADCGEYFETCFEPDLDYANELLSEVGNGINVSEPLKWKLDIAFYNFEYLEKEAQDVLLLIANKILNQKRG